MLLSYVKTKQSVSMIIFGIFMFIFWPFQHHWGSCLSVRVWLLCFPLQGWRAWSALSQRVRDRSLWACFLRTASENVVGCSLLRTIWSSFSLGSVYQWLPSLPASSWRPPSTASRGSKLTEQMRRRGKTECKPARLQLRISYTNKFMDVRTEDWEMGPYVSVVPKDLFLPGSDKGEAE